MSNKILIPSIFLIVFLLIGGAIVWQRNQPVETVPAQVTRKVEKRTYSKNIVFNQVSEPIESTAAAAPTVATSIPAVSGAPSPTEKLSVVVGYPTTATSESSTITTTISPTSVLSASPSKNPTPTSKQTQTTTNLPKSGSIATTLLLSGLAIAVMALAFVL